MIKYFFEAFTVLLFSIYEVAFCQSEVYEKRSTIVEVDGYAYLSEDKTIRELKEEALSNAKKEVLERTQTYIKSFTKVENFMLTYDLIQSKAEGYVKILESKDYGVRTDHRYHIWIKAEVEYVLGKSKEDVPSSLLTNEDAPLTVSVWTEKNEYKSDEEIRIFLQGNKNFYARVIYKDVSGNVLQLLPNQHHKDNFFEGGKILVIPDKADSFKLVVESPFGKEWIIVYASTAPLGELSVVDYGNDLYQVRGGLEDISIQTRGIKIANKGYDNQGADFYEVKCNLITNEK